jgi:argininosuccinate lyase
MSEPETPATPARSLGGRFREPTHPVLERTNRSVEVDQRLWAEDIAGSRAHAEMLGRAGLISDDDVVALLGGLAVVEAEFAHGAFRFFPSDEDIHMAVERRLGEIAGEPARRLHTGRSRNDQVMTDTLLWLRSAVGRVEAGLVTLIDGLTRRAAEAADTPMPSFTHSQPAQVASAGAWLLAHAVEVDRNLRRAADLQDRLDWCPLGSGASAGTYLPTEREHLAASLGFAEPALSGIHATGSRSDLLDAVALCGMVGVMLSRLGEELVLYASPAYGFVELPDGLTTGSSLLPHKRNPDGAELLRGGGRLLATEFGALASFCGGLVSGYSKDLQHDKEVLFRAMDRTIDLLDLAAPHVDQLTLRSDRLRAACGPELAALWLADRLVLAGLPFREAHHRVGAAVRRAQEEGLSLADGLRATPGEEHAAVAIELETLTPELLLTGLRSPGSARPDHVRAAAARLRARWIAAG